MIICIYIYSFIQERYWWKSNQVTAWYVSTSGRREDYIEFTFDFLCLKKKRFYLNNIIIMYLFLNRMLRMRWNYYEF